MKMHDVAVLLGTALLAGCAASVQPVPTTVATPGMPNPEMALQKSMSDVNAEMAELGLLTPAATTPASTGFISGHCRWKKSAGGNPASRMPWHRISDRRTAQATPRTPPRRKGGCP